MPGATPPRLLVFVSHEPWIAQLDGLGYALDLVGDLPGRARAWDTRARPLPAGARIVPLAEAATRRDYLAVVAHSPSDLLAARAIAAPRLLIVHNTLEGRVLEEGTSQPPSILRQAFARLVADTACFPVAVSPLKGASWGVADGWLGFGIDVDGFGPHVGSLACGLRVANHVLRRPRILQWAVHVAAFDGVPLTLVGENPGWRGVQPARSFAHLKDLYRAHRFYVHTADAALEDGYNMASLEAMASGLPVLGTGHPTSVVEDGVTGYVSDDPGALRVRALELIASPEQVARLGAAAREMVRERFSHAAFARLFARAIEEARGRWHRDACVAPGTAPAGAE